MSEIIDEKGVTHLMFNVQREDYRTFQAFMQKNPISQFEEIDDFIDAVRHCLYEAYRITDLFPLEFEIWMLQYDKAVTKEMKKYSANIYQTYNIQTINTGHDPLAITGKMVEINKIDIRKNK